VSSISGGGIQPGSTFQVFYQTHLISFSTSSGSFSPAGLNSTFQITEVASFTALVSPLSTPTATSLSLAPVQTANSGIKMWYSPGNPSNQASGAGFTTAGSNPGGTSPGLIFSASPTANQSNYTDTTKLPPPPPGGQPIVLLDQSGSGNYPGITTDQGTGT